MRPLDGELVEMEKTCSKIRMTLAAGLWAISVPTLGMSDEYEKTPLLSASNTFLDLPLQTDLYQIQEPVPTDGFMALYTITSPYGEFSASGPGVLETRLNEIRALAALQTVQDDDRFIEAAEDTAKDTANNLKRFVENPKETLRGVPEGVGGFFNRTGRAVKTGVQKLGDVRQGRVPGIEGDAVSNLPGGASSVNTSDVSFAESVVRAGGDTAVNMLGFDKQRRRLAKELAVDPYTTNRILSEKLDEVTWAAFAGGLGANVLTSLVPGGFILSTSSRLSDWVWDTSPGDLRVEIEARLLAMGVSQTEIDRFLRHGYYSMSMQAVLTASLNALDGVAGRADVMPLVLSAGSEGQARFLVQAMDMLRNYHLSITPLTALYIQGTAIGVDAVGRTVVVAPVDYVSWTPTLDRFASNVGQSFELERSLHVSGAISERARDELTSIGWTVEENSPLGRFAYPVQ